MRFIILPVSEKLASNTYLEIKHQLTADRVGSVCFRHRVPRDLKTQCRDLFIDFIVDVFDQKALWMVCA
jgi:hypothetical protein